MLVCNYQRGFPPHADRETHTRRPLIFLHLNCLNIFILARYHYRATRQWSLWSEILIEILSGQGREQAPTIDPT
jgi:hypothetical protein